MIKITKLLFIGLTVAVIIYPLLHETGHILSMFFFKADIKEITYFSVLCDIGTVSKTKQFLIALSGNLFPILLSLIWKPRSKNLLFANIILKILNIYYVVLNIIYAFMYAFQVPVKNSDITIMLNINSELFFVIIFSHMLLIIVLITLVHKNKPIKLCISLLLETSDFE